MSWWVKALLAGSVLVLACIGAGFALDWAAPLDQWQLTAFLLLVFVSIYLVSIGIPRRYAPSHTQGTRSAIQHAGLERPAFLMGRNPGIEPRSRTSNPDSIVAAIPLIVTAVVLGLTL
jgi:hypothetical protein